MTPSWPCLRTPRPKVLGQQRNHLAPARLGISRQRYWGIADPIVYCPKDGIVPVPDKDLPFCFPKCPTHREGGSPLGALRICEHHLPEMRRSRAPRDRPRWTRSLILLGIFIATAIRKTTKLPSTRQSCLLVSIDQYIGGITHASCTCSIRVSGAQVMRDLGLVNHKRPIAHPFHKAWCKRACGHVQIKGQCSSAMEMAAKYGADTGRLYTLFAAPPKKIWSGRRKHRRRLGSSTAFSAWSSPRRVTPRTSKRHSNSTSDSEKALLARPINPPPRHAGH